MNNYINIPLTPITLKAGDRVRLVEPEGAKYEKT